METENETKDRTESGERWGRFLHELSRRRVWRTAIAYGAVVFVLLQLGEIVLPAFGAPDWALRLLIRASLLGLPLVLALAWVFDITPQGIHRTEVAAPEGAAEGIAGSSFPRLALLAVTLATVGGVGWWSVKDTLQNSSSGPVGGSDSLVIPASLEEDPLAVTSLAVLPLDDFSQDEGGGYFTAGFHDELVSQLSQIGAARVVSRTSVVQYDRTGKAMPAIARDLGVDGVVEGSVFRDGNRVRITVQLIHGPTDQHLWAESYEGTLDDAIALQREVAEAVADAIQTEIFPETKEGRRPERIAASRDARSEYFQGRYELGKATPEALSAAAEHYEAALEEDSAFAPAYAGLAATHFLMGLGSQDSLAPDPLSDPRVTHPLEMAFQIDKDSHEARAVMLSIQEAVGRIPELDLPAGVRIFVDSAGYLQEGLNLAASEFGNEIQRAATGRRVVPNRSKDLSERMVHVRQLQLGANYAQAEGLIRDIIEEVPGSQQAWDALEDLQTVKRDFQGVAEVRRARLEQTGDNPEAEASLHELERLLETDGEAGYWRWCLEELEGQMSQGQPVSPVELARAHVGLGHLDRAVPLLRQALEEKDQNLISLWTDPAWEALRDDPDFRDILMEVRRGGVFPGL